MVAIASFGTLTIDITELLSFDRTITPNVVEVEKVMAKSNLQTTGLKLNSYSLRVRFAQPYTVDPRASLAAWVSAANSFTTGSLIIANETIGNAIISGIMASQKTTTYAIAIDMTVSLMEVSS